MRGCDPVEGEAGDRVKVEIICSVGAGEGRTSNNCRSESPSGNNLREASAFRQQQAADGAEQRVAGGFVLG